MIATVAPMSVPLQMMPDASAEARKRRREILASQRNQALDAEVRAPLQLSAEVELHQAKRHKPNTVTSANIKPAKKPQMKYDPDVPMTKEEATAWRREQRRKRNRESAAASRQRQRDRITELEEEVEDWKCKYEAIMENIKKLEQASGKSSIDLSLEQTQPVGSFSKFVSPPSSPGHSPVYDERVASPVASSSQIASVNQVTPKEDTVNVLAVQVEPEHSDKMISRQAAS